MDAAQDRRQGRHAGRDQKYRGKRTKNQEKTRRAPGELFNLPKAAVAGETPTTVTYEALLDRARTLLELGEPVLLDASWSSNQWREAARAIAADTVADLVELRCDAPMEVARQRLVARAGSDADASDATTAIAARMAGAADDWPTAVTIDTSRSREESANAALARL